MKEILEKLWNEYLFEECSAIDTDEERRIMKKTAELQEKANALLNKEQQEAMEKYIEALYDGETLFVKKAFFKGVGLAVSLLFKAFSAGEGVK